MEMIKSKGMLAGVIGMVMGVLMIMALIGGEVFGAGSSMTVSGDSIISNATTAKPMFRVITIIFTADDANGTIPDLVLNAATAGLFHGSPIGWLGYSVIIDCNHAGTEPSENSELYIYNTGGGDMLGGQGVDQVDNTVERHVYFHNGTTPMKQPMVSAWTVRVTQQAAAVNSATGTIQIVMVME